MNQAEMKGNHRKTALYSRLSIDDGAPGESMSISSQKLILEGYAREHGLIPFVHYSDDGYSGTNFNRPAFQQMIADIEKGEIGCVITKDLSRLGRNYIESGGYIEVFFPRHNVRYISVNDGIDSTNNTGMDITPFKNILNEFYSRDIAKKVKTGKDIRARQGKYMCTTPPFGYQKDPADKNHLIIDPATAPTVKLIFDLALEGLGNNRIRKILYERKILKPACYKPEHFGKFIIKDDDPYDWKRETISRLLRNPIYKGGMWVHTCSKPSFKFPGRGYIQKQDREIIEDVHEAIVSKQQWETVQEIMDKHSTVRPCKSGYENIFRRLLYCPDCGRVMLVHTDGRNENRPLEDKTYYLCSTYRCHGKQFCSSHRISVEALKKAVLEDIRHHALLAMEDPEGYVRQILMDMDADNEHSREDMEREKAQLQEQAKNLSQQFIRLYDDFSRGLVSEKQYQMLSAHYETQQNDCDRRIAELEQTLAKTSAERLNVERFAQEIAGYAGITELTGTILNSLISRIDVHEAVDMGGNKSIALDIHYKFAV